MGTILASTLVSKASTLLFDGNAVKWSQAELLQWLSDAQRATVALLPEASSTVVTVKCVAGTRQALPTGGWLLLEVTRNMGSNGATPGRVVKRVDRATLDETNPNWYSAAPVTTVTTYSYNPRDRAAYYVSPPSDGTGYLEVNYSALPVEITAGSTPIILADIYAPALLDYMLWRAKLKMVPFAGDPKDAQSHFEAWSMFVTGDAQSVGSLTQGMGALKESTPQIMGTTGAR